MFKRGDGADVITDFTAGGTDDRLVIRGYADYRELVQQGADTLVVFSDHDSILLKNVQVSAVQDSDFTFGGGGAPSPAPAPAPAALAEALLHHDWLLG